MGVALFLFRGSDQWRTVVYSGVTSLLQIPSPFYDLQTLTA